MELSSNCPDLKILPPPELHLVRWSTVESRHSNSLMSRFVKRPTCELTPDRSLIFSKARESVGLMS